MKKSTKDDQFVSDEYSLLVNKEETKQSEITQPLFKTLTRTLSGTLNETEVSGANESKKGSLADFNRLSVLTKVLLAIAIAGEIAGLVLACIQIYLYPNVFFSYVALTLATFALIASLASLSEKVDEYNVLPGGLK